MIKRFAQIAALLATALVAVLCATAARGMEGRGAPNGKPPVLASQDPNVAACMARGEQNCNPDPSVYATFVAQNPIAQPPNANAHLLAESDVLAQARGKNTQAPAAAQLVSYKDVEGLMRGLGSNAVVHPERKVWVVTVQGDTETPGSLTEAPRTVHVYSVVIDAETGQVTDMCYGCAAVPVK